MRICIVVRILWSAGAQKIAIEEAIALTKMGHEVDLVFLRRGSTWRVYEDLLKEVNYRVISEAKSSILTGLYSFITGLFMPDRKGEGRVDYDLLRRMPEIVSQFNPDKIICHDQWTGIGGLLTMKEKGIPYEVFLHERLGKLRVPILGRIAERYISKVLKSASRIYAVTEKIASDSNEKLGFHVVADPPGFESLENVVKNNRVNRVISVSMWDEGRNPFFFVELEKILKDYQIMLVGNWRNNEFLKRFLGSLPVGSNIILKTGVSEDEKRKLIMESKYFVRVGYTEFGLATGVIESISCGTPVVINSDLGTADMIRKYEAGYVIDSVHPTDFGRVILNTTDDRYEDMLRKVKKLQESWNWQNHAEKLL